MLEQWGNAKTNYPGQMCVSLHDRAHIKAKQMQTIDANSPKLRALC